MRTPRPSDDYATPLWLLELMFPDGRFFDPCPLGGFPDGRDGLTMEWPEDVPFFINPPFSGPLPWVKRGAEHKGAAGGALLLQVDPTTAWWTFSPGFKVTLIGSRLHFNDMATYARHTLCIWRK